MPCSLPICCVCPSLVKEEGAAIVTPLTICKSKAIQTTSCRLKLEYCEVSVDDASMAIQTTKCTCNRLQVEYCEVPVAGSTCCSLQLEYCEVPVAGGSPCGVLALYIRHSLMGS